MDAEVKWCASKGAMTWRKPDDRRGARSNQTSKQAGKADGPVGGNQTYLRQDGPPARDCTDQAIPSYVIL